MTRTIASLVCLVSLVALHAHAQSAPPAPSRAAVAPSRPVALVNLNTATQDELESLPGIGARTAERIIDYRTKKGPFKKIEDLMNVQGIGEKSFLKLKPQLTVTSKPDARTP